MRRRDVGDFRGLIVILIGLFLLTHYAEANAANSLDVVINEIAWMGTQASSADEWIELYNNTDNPIDLTDWGILEVDGAGGETLIEPLSGTIGAHSYYLIERTDDNTVSDIPADQPPSGWGGYGLSNNGEHLILKDNLGNVIDEIDASGGWFAGTASPDYRSMERIDPTASGSDPSNWATNDPAIARNGLDAGGNSINGTPRSRNSATNSPPTANAGPDQIVAVDSTVQLDGSGSADPDSDPLIYRWSFTSRPAGSAAALSDPNIVNPAFIADVAGDYVLELTVDDGRGGTDFDQVTITAVGRGDANDDGKIDLQDVILAAKFALDLLTPSEVQRKAADVVTPCGAIDVRDVVWIAEVALGIKDESAFTCSGLSGGSLGLAAPSIHRSRTIRLRIADKGIIPGGRANIGISASAAVEGLQVGPEGSLSFDPKIIQIREIRGISPFQVLAQEIDNEAGRVKFMAIALGEPQSGEIIELEVEAVGQEGERTVVELALDMALDTGGSELEAEITGGRLTIGRAMPLRVERVLSFPNPASGDSVRFVVEGQGIEDVQVRIYDLSGREVFNSGWVPGETFEWNLMGSQGRVVANGVYLYIVAVRGFGEGELASSKVKKLVILR